MVRWPGAETGVCGVSRDSEREKPENETEGLSKRPVIRSRSDVSVRFCRPDRNAVQRHICSGPPDHLKARLRALPCLGRTLSTIWNCIRANPPLDMAEGQVNRALDILESPWPRREEMMLREWFESEEQEGAELSRFLIEQILDTGLEPVEPPPLLPPIAPPTAAARRRNRCASRSWRRSWTSRRARPICRARIRMPAW